MNRGVTVTDQEIRRFYDRNVDKKNSRALYYKPEIAQIAVVVTTKEEDCRKAFAEYKNGVSWKRVVQNYSEDKRNPASDGILPAIARGRTQWAKVPALEETIFGLKIGGMAGPQKFAGAWWIIRCIDKKPEKIISFEQVKEDCRTGAQLLKGIPANGK